MSADKLLLELNPSQRVAATHLKNHALVLAGAGCGKTKTIIARAAFLISQGVSPDRIQILTFTRRSASEIVERVKTHLGDSSQGLRSSTFHTWCTSIIRRAPTAFGFKKFTVIDRDDQLQLFKLLRGKRASGNFPTAAQICDLYSFARNTRTSLDATLKKQSPNYYNQKEPIASIMKEYELRKRSRNYFDYDDILDIVAKGINQHEELCKWVGTQFDHILVDEMQDTNPLQWELLEPLTKYVKLFCVGDDAQSIYGFRGADFKNVHSFQERLPDSTILRLEDNYRSTQEILDISNWLLKSSTINYDKKLKSMRGFGLIPKIHTFSNEWEEGRWIAEDLIKRRVSGSLWKNHMILVRSSFSARTVEAALLAKEIPYIFIGGTKLLDAAHVKDVLSVLRLIGNNQDEIGWMRYLTLWSGVGEVKAGKIINEILNHDNTNDAISTLETEGYGSSELASVIKELIQIEGSVSKIISKAVKLMTDMLANKYKNQDWEKRQRDFSFVEKLAEKHSSVLEFLEEYILDPIFNSERDRIENEDIVTIITIHSAKGTEREVCYVQNVSTGSYPPAFAINDLDDVEEERRVLYVALTRAKNELIITRKMHNTWSYENVKKSNPNEELNVEDSGDNNKLIESYFLNGLPEQLASEDVHTNNVNSLRSANINQKLNIEFGIDLS
ncbi:MAG: ATP-dependent helicase [Candidatus Saccharibacteria bacterium]|nr:ATP-dependent helicase [Moraxellaceae bacterium]